MLRNSQERKWRITVEKYERVYADVLDGWSEG